MIHGSEEQGEEVEREAREGGEAREVRGEGEERACQAKT